MADNPLIRAPRVAFIQVQEHVQEQQNGEGRKWRLMDFAFFLEASHLRLNAGV